MINAFDIESIAEIGVFTGNFAAKILRSSASIKKYYMIDPWRNLEDWNKPINNRSNNETFNKFYEEAIKNTEFASNKRIILRGKTTEVIARIPDNSLDFIYIDGDHTLKGIAIDLIRSYPKLKKGGFIGGDDFSASIWQHSQEFEPTLVCPFAIYFAEAISAKIYALPYNQFLIEKQENDTFNCVDFTEKYSDISLRKQLINKTV